MQPVHAMLDSLAASGKTFPGLIQNTSEAPVVHTIKVTNTGKLDADGMSLCKWSPLFSICL
jgi:hypothetical protein